MISLMFRVCAFVLMAAARFKFPRNKSIANIIRNRYSNDVLKLVRRFETSDFRYRKLLLDLEYLNKCSDKQLTPKFLRFRVANSYLKSSTAYHRSQVLLLNEEIKFKDSSARTIKRKLDACKDKLKGTLSFLDFSHVCSVFLCSNDNRLNKIREVQDKKLFQLNSEKVKVTLNPDKVIHNFSSVNLSENDKSLLAKGLNYSLSPEKLNYADYCLNFELFYRDISYLNLDSATKDFIKSKLKDVALSSFYEYNDTGHIPDNLSKNEFACLQKLASNRDIIIQKSDKGNSIVILDNISYVERILEILNDNSKFVKLTDKNIQNNKELQFIDKHEEKIRVFLKKLLVSNKISKQQHDNMYPIGSRPGIMYGLAKIHKALVNNFPKFRPILSTIGTCSYKLAKFLVPVLANVTDNEYTIKDSFQFGKDVLQLDSNLYMGSLDVEALFTNLPLTETIDITISRLFENNELVCNLNQTEFRQLLEMATYEPWFIFNNTYFKQTDGVAMGSPLGPSLANIFMSHHEKTWLQNCPDDFKPVYYRRYVDDIFVLFKSPEHLGQFKNYFNTCHLHMKFTSEDERDDQMPFLDFLFMRKEGKFTSSVYRKPTFTGIYTNFHSFTPQSYKQGLIYTLLHRIVSICCNYETILIEIGKLRTILMMNNYPNNIIDKCIYIFFNKLNIVKDVVHTVEKKKLMLLLPFLGTYSLATKKKLEKLFHEKLPFCDIRIIFRCQKRLRNFFHFKDRIPMSLLSHNVYFFKCPGCNSSSYYGSSERHTMVRYGDHLGFSWRTGAKIVGVSTEIKSHLKTCKCKASIKDFKIIASDDNPLKLRIKESLFIKKDQPVLNKNTYATPLYLF